MLETSVPDKSRRGPVPFLSRPKVERCIEKGLQIGALAALSDLPRMGLLAGITLEARAWVVSLAYVKSGDLGYPEELWTTRLLAHHARTASRPGIRVSHDSAGVRCRRSWPAAGYGHTRSSTLWRSTNRS